VRRRRGGTAQQGGSATRGQCGEGAPPVLQPCAAPPSHTGSADLRVLELRRRCWLGGRAARRCGGSACTTSSSRPRQKVRSTHGPPGQRGAVATSPSSNTRPACSRFEVKVSPCRVPLVVILLQVLLDGRRSILSCCPPHPLPSASPTRGLAERGAGEIRSGAAQRGRASTMAWWQRPCTGAPPCCWWELHPSAHGGQRPTTG
jgi:hypothetical protein